MDEDEVKSTLIHVKIDAYQNAFLENLLKEYRKTNPNMTKSQVIRNILSAFEALMTTPLVALLKPLPQDKIDKNKKKK